MVSWGRHGSTISSSTIPNTTCASISTSVCTSVLYDVAKSAAVHPLVAVVLLLVSIVHLSFVLMMAAILLLLNILLLVTSVLQLASILLLVTSVLPLASVLLLLVLPLVVVAPELLLVLLVLSAVVLRNPRAQLGRPCMLYIQLLLVVYCHALLHLGVFRHA